MRGAGRLLGLCIVLGALAVTAEAQTEVQNNITALNVATAANGDTVIKVDLAQPLANLPAGFTIETPPRLAFDFSNTTNGLGKSVQNFTEGDLRSANIVQAGSRTRLVINLNQMVAYDTKIDGNSLLITLHGKGAAVAASRETSRFAEAKAGAQKHNLRDIEFRRGAGGEGRIQVDLSDPGIGIDIRRQGTTLVVDFQKTSLPRNLQRKLDVVDFGTPVQKVDTFAQGDNVRMVIEPKGLWEHAAYQADNKFIVEVKPVVEEPGKLTKGGLGYSGEKLTLNFQKIDVREALNVIADFTNLNMVISDTVSGNITLRLKDVPWDQALDIILQSRGLAMRKNGNVIQVAPREEIAAKEKNELTERQEIIDLEPLRTESFQLNYQKGDAVVALLSSSKQRILSTRGSAVVDPRTNTVFIQDTPTRLDEARKIIKQIDVPVRQVLIEARIVEASDKFGRDLGVKLRYTDPGAVRGGGFAVGSNTPAVPRATVNGSNVNLPFITNAAAAGTFSFTLFNAAATKLLSLELTALETDSTGKIISSPRVVTADQVEATIEQGTEVPYQEASSSGATTTSFKKASLILKVKPQITPEDNVIMDVNVSKDSIGADRFNGVPNIDTNKVQTQVLIENGGTVVIGGVYVRNLNDAVHKVPVLGDVPVVGWLFKNSEKTDNKSELLIFLTPKIIKEAMGLH
ncbi:MAG TPA: type IV pilus secretin PilQ [Gallionella sp.]|nr:type IV pilus secretin PilQ [Gallionella sp.]